MGLNVDKVRSKKCKVCGNQFRTCDSFRRWCSPECGVILAKEAQEKQWHKEQAAKKLTRIVYSEKEEKLITLIEYAKKQGKLRITPYNSIGSIAVTKARNIIALVNAGKGKSLYQHKGTSVNPGIIIRKKNK